MAGKIEIIDQPSGGLWQGVYGEQIKGDNVPYDSPKRNLYPNAPRQIRTQRKPQETVFNYPIPAETAQNTQIRNNLVTQGALEKYLSQAFNGGYTQPQAQGQTATQATATATSSITDFISQNKWLVIGGVAVIGYFVLAGSGGGGLLEKNVITRYAKR